MADGTELPEVMNSSSEAGNTPLPAAGSPLLDPSRYLPMLDDFEISEEEKHKFLEALWSIMTSFVDLGFGVDSVSLLLADIYKNSMDDAEDTVNLNNIPDTDNKAIAAINAAKPEEST